ncbi:MAG: helix-turn-helix domain-containing protein, partial [Oscillospiraceae bacterium]|nr:helix-turn-helix domain-containing protein [Oscillospiraceae bacterium]
TELFYVVGGRGMFRLEDETFPLEADDLLVVGPNVEHTEMGVANDPLEYIVLGIEGLEFVFSGEDTRCARLPYREYRGDTLLCLDLMLREMEKKAESHADICQRLLEILILQLIRNSSCAVTPAASRRSSRECAVVKRYIDQNYRENITLDMLAQLTHMNKYYLVHVFNRENGKSPISYLIDRRIRESMHLLANTDHSLSEISQMLGFSSQSYFSQSFKKSQGVTPNEYRRRHKHQTKGEEENLKE